MNRAIKSYDAHTENEPYGREKVALALIFCDSKVFKTIEHNQGTTTWGAPVKRFHTAPGGAPFGSVVGWWALLPLAVVL